MSALRPLPASWLDPPKKTELQALCRERKLSTKGTVYELCQRLSEHEIKHRKPYSEYNDVNDHDGTKRAAQKFIIKADVSRDASAIAQKDGGERKKAGDKLFLDHEAYGKEQEKREAEEKRLGTSKDVPYSFLPFAEYTFPIRGNYLFLPTEKACDEGIRTLLRMLHKYKPTDVEMDEKGYYISFSIRVDVVTTRLACWKVWGHRPLWLCKERLLMEMRKNDEDGKLVRIRPHGSISKAALEAAGEAAQEVLNSKKKRSHDGQTSDPPQPTKKAKSEPLMQRPSRFPYLYMPCTTDGKEKKEFHRDLLGSFAAYSPEAITSDDCAFYITFPDNVKGRKSCSKCYKFWGEKVFKFAGAKLHIDFVSSVEDM